MSRKNLIVSIAILSALGLVAIEIFREIVIVNDNLAIRVATRRFL